VFGHPYEQCEQQHQPKITKHLPGRTRIGMPVSQLGQQPLEP
jgi:hypothetical protein